MIASRKALPSLIRSRFWRENVHWYGVGLDVDLSHDSHSLAYFLSGASQQDDDRYVTIIAYWEDLFFTVQEGRYRVGAGLSIRACRDRTAFVRLGRNKSFNR